MVGKVGSYSLRSISVDESKSIMPARDIYHNNLKNALIKDQWTITHDPLRLIWGNKDMYVDLGAEKILKAEKLGIKIAVELKTFGGKSEVNDLEDALGQYFLYYSVIKRRESERTLYLAIQNKVFLDIFENDLGKLILEDYQIPLIVFSIKEEVILQWIPKNPIVN
ncbi:MAG: XisH family protein [Lyngbya sp.]|nr:XisH family protein [Lyngbya sp.]